MAGKSLEPLLGEWVIETADQLVGVLQVALIALCSALTFEIATTGPDADEHYSLGDDLLDWIFDPAGSVTGYLSAMGSRWDPQWDAGAGLVIAC